MSRLCVLVLLLCAIGCGPKLPPDASPEAKLAVRADQIVNAMRQVLPSLKPLVCQAGATTNCITPADADRVADVLSKGFTHAENLGKALQAVDEAKTASERSAGMQKAHQFVLALSDTLSRAQIAPGDEPARLLVLQLLATVSALLLTIGGA